MTYYLWILYQSDTEASQFDYMIKKKNHSFFDNYNDYVGMKFKFG